MLIEDDDAEEEGDDRLGEHERRHLGGRETLQPAGEEDVGDGGGKDAEVERKRDPLTRAKPGGLAEDEDGEQEHGAEAERGPHDREGGVTAPEDQLGDHGVGRVAEPGDEGECDPVDGQRAAVPRGERQNGDAGNGSRGRSEPATAGPDSEGGSLEQSREHWPRADRHHRADADPCPRDGLEEGELVDRDADAGKCHEPERPLVRANHRSRRRRLRAGCRRSGCAPLRP